jgi:hypothetical protein
MPKKLGQWVLAYVSFVVVFPVVASIGHDTNSAEWLIASAEGRLMFFSILASHIFSRSKDG